MNATLNIDDKVLDTARGIASRRDVPLDDVVNDLLRTALASRAILDPELGMPVLTSPEGTPPMDLRKIEQALAEGP